MHITNIFLFSLVFFASTISSMEQQLRVIEKKILTLLQLPVDVHFALATCCPSKEPLRKTCTYFYNFFKKNKENILCNELLAINEEALKKFFLYYGILGNAAIVRNLLKKGADPHTSNRKDGTLMHFAAQYNYTEIMAELLKHPSLYKPFLQSNENSPLYLAIKYDQKDILKQILSVHPIDSNKALWYAAKNNAFKMIRMLDKDLCDHTEINFLFNKLSQLIYKKEDISLNSLETLSVTAKEWISKFKSTASGFNDITDRFNELKSMDALKEFVFYHVCLGNCAIIQDCLACGVDPNIQDDKYMTLMHYAAKFGHLDVINLLLEHPAYIQDHIADGKNSPFYFAMKYNQPAVIKRMLEICTVDHADALCYAIEQGLFNVVQTLISCGIDVNATDKEGFFPLFVAARTGDICLPITKLLIDNGALVNNQINNDATKANDFIGACALHIAIPFGNTHTIQLLLNCGANVNIQNMNLVTPLHTAASFEQESVIDLLISYNADVNKKDKDGKTALHYVEKIGTLKRLLAYPEVQINEQDIDGNTPLHLAALSLSFIQELLKREDILINVENYAKRTPLDIVNLTYAKWGLDDGQKHSPMDAIEELLIAHGGKRHEQPKNKPKDSKDNCAVQ